MPVFGQRRSEPTEATNPFLAQQLADATPVVTATVDPEGDELLGDALSWDGPVVPLGTPAPQHPVMNFAPAAGEWRTGALAVVPLHGGAGASTLCSLLGDNTVDCPTLTIPMLPAEQEVDVLLVARTHGLGLERTLQAASEWAAGTWSTVGRVGLVLVPDGPKLAKPLRAQGTRASRVFPKTWRLPWVEEWRINAVPTLPDKTPLRITLTRKEISQYYTRKDPRS